MGLRGSRLMTSVFLTRGHRLLLLYRIGSSAVPDSWVGVGGHVEPAELRDPTAAVLRELEEEIAVAPGDVRGLALRYVSVRDDGEEVRITYYFVAELNAQAAEPVDCTEGELRWFDLDDPELMSLSMPPTAAVALGHWIAEGRHDGALRSILVTSGVPQVLLMSEVGDPRPHSSG